MRITQRAVRIPVAIAAVLVGLHFAWVIASFGFDWKSQTAGDLFDLGTESNVGTWLSGVVLLAGGLVAALLAHRAGRDDRRGWAIIAAALVLCSVDEVGAVHEAFSQDVSDGLDTHGVFHYGWVIPAIVVVVAVVIALAPFVRRLPRDVGRPLALGAFVFVGGALGIEMLEGLLDESHDPASLGNTLVRGGQEIVELAGALLVLWALLGAARHIEVSVANDNISGKSR